MKFVSGGVAATVTIPNSGVSYLAISSVNGSDFRAIIGDTYPPSVKYVAYVEDEPLKLNTQKNIFNKDELVLGYSVNYLDGNIDALSGAGLSRYIPVKPNTNYRSEEHTSELQ